MFPPLAPTSLFAPLRHAAARAWCAALIVLALALHGLVPLGYMPETGKGLFAVRICHGGSLQTIFVDGEGHKVDPSGGKKNIPAPPCVFSLAGLFTSDGAAPFFAVLLIAALIALLRPGCQRIASRRDMTTYAPRGPPALCA